MTSNSSQLMNGVRTMILPVSSPGCLHAMVLRDRRGGASQACDSFVPVAAMTAAEITGRR